MTIKDKKTIKKRLKIKHIGRNDAANLYRNDYAAAVVASQASRISGGGIGVGTGGGSADLIFSNSCELTPISKPPALASDAAGVSYRHSFSPSPATPPSSQTSSETPNAATAALIFARSGKTAPQSKHRDENSGVNSLPPLQTKQQKKQQQSGQFEVFSPNGNNSEDEYYTNENQQGCTADYLSNLEQMKKFLHDQRGWEIVQVKSDGACLYRSTAHQIYGDEQAYEKVRNQVLEYMATNRDHFSQFVSEDFDRYIRRKRRHDTHGNHLEICAISELFNRPIEIYQNCTTLEPMKLLNYKVDAALAGLTPIRLSYHGSIHYNSVVDPYDPAYGVGLGMPDNLQPKLGESDLMTRAKQESEQSAIEEVMMRDKVYQTESEEIDDQLMSHAVHRSYNEQQQQHHRNTPPHHHPHHQQQQHHRLLNQNNNHHPHHHHATSSSSSSSMSTSSAAALVCSSSSNSAIGHSAAHRKLLASPPRSTCCSTNQRGSGESPRNRMTSSQDAALLRNIPPEMLDMDEDAIIAMVINESTRSFYQENHRGGATAASGDNKTCVAKSKSPPPPPSSSRNSECRGGEEFERSSSAPPSSCSPQIFNHVSPNHHRN